MAIHGVLNSKIKVKEVIMNRPFHKRTLCTVLFVLFIIMTGQGVLANEAQVIFGVG